MVAIPFASGWEVADSIEALTVNDQPRLSYTSDCKAYDQSGQQVRPFLGVGPPSPSQLPLSECSTGASNWRIDVDAQYSGRPSLFIETSPVRHTNFQGIQTDNGLAVESRIVTRQRDTYYLDYHVFMFDFRVRTVADVKATACIRNALLQEVCVFDHETSAEIGCFPTLATICGTNGKLFDGSSFVGFGINPWQGARIAPEGTIRFGQWVGIMQAIIQTAEAGFDTKVPQDSPGSATAVLATGAAANMFTLAGQDQPKFQFGTASLDDAIPQFILIELPYRLLPGADWTIAPGSGYSSLVPSNVNVHYVVRVDVLLVTGWQPQLDYIDANSNGIQDTGEFTFIDKNNDNRWTLGTDEAVSGTPPSESTTASKEAGLVLPESPPQTGSQLEELGPIPDLTIPAPCEFWNISCFFNTAFNFPTVSSITSLLTVLAVIVLLVFGASIFLGRRRGR